MSLHIFFPAFALGLLSSFHCVGMCGAIALSVPANQPSTPARIVGILLYNLGRIATYAFLGILFGIVGRQIYLGGLQQWFSIIAGSIIVVVALKSYLGSRLKLPGMDKINRLTQGLMIKFLRSGSSSGAFMLGMANGLLPCGLVYLAVAAALATGGVPNAAGFMISFGIGTFPAMFLLSFFGVLTGVSTRNKIRRLMPYMIAVVGALLIVRGLGLGIPFVSPVLPAPAQHIIDCH